MLDTETTGLPDENGLPDIVSLGINVVRRREIQRAVEFMTRPQQPISAEARAIHGISDTEAAAFEPFGSQCQKILKFLTNQLVVIHNASFDWPILVDHLARADSSPPIIEGVFCSQKAATPWAQSIGLPCSSRGPLRFPEMPVAFRHGGSSPGSVADALADQLNQLLQLGFVR